MNDPAVWIPIIAAIFGSGGMSWIVVLVRDKRKADSEARNHDANTTQLIEAASGALVSRYQQVWKEDQEKIRELEGRDRAHNQYARAHEEWDRKAVEALAAVGVSLPPPPLLRLPEEADL